MEGLSHAKWATWAVGMIGGKGEEEFDYWEYAKCRVGGFREFWRRVGGGGGVL